VTDLRVRPDAVLIALLGAAVTMAVAHVAALSLAIMLGIPSGSPFVQAWNMDHEPSIPTLLAMVEWVIAFLLASLIAVRQRRAGLLHARAWSALAVVLAYLLADEQLGLHEALSDAVKIAAGDDSYRAGWVIPYVVAAAAGLAVGHRFLSELPASVRWWMLLSIVTFGAGAVGFEVLASRYLLQHGHDTFYFLTYVPAEELLELVGIAFLIRALLEFVACTQPMVQVQVQRS
jgi:hypothetical protein